MQRSSDAVAVADGPADSSKNISVSKAMTTIKSTPELPLALPVSVRSTTEWCSRVICDAVAKCSSSKHPHVALSWTSAFASPRMDACARFLETRHLPPFSSRCSAIPSISGKAVRSARTTTCDRSGEYRSGSSRPMMAAIRASNGPSVLCVSRLCRNSTSLVSTIFFRPYLQKKRRGDER